MTQHDLEMVLLGAFLMLGLIALVAWLLPYEAPDMYESRSIQMPEQLLEWLDENRITFIRDTEEQG